jgi:hypothetical protein
LDPKTALRYSNGESRYSDAAGRAIGAEWFGGFVFAGGRLLWPFAWTGSRGATAGRRVDLISGEIVSDRFPKTILEVGRFFPDDFGWPPVGNNQRARLPFFRAAVTDCARLGCFLWAGW